MQQSPVGNTSKMLKWNINSGWKIFILRDVIWKQTEDNSWEDTTEQNFAFAYT